MMRSPFGLLVWQGSPTKAVMMPTWTEHLSVALKLKGCAQLQLDHVCLH